MVPLLCLSACWDPISLLSGKVFREFWGSNPGLDACPSGSAMDARSGVSPERFAEERGGEEGFGCLACLPARTRSHSLQERFSGASGARTRDWLLAPVLLPWMREAGCLPSPLQGRGEKGRGFGCLASLLGPDPAAGVVTEGLEPGLAAPTSQRFCSMDEARGLRALPRGWRESCGLLGRGPDCLPNLRVLCCCSQSRDLESI